MIFTRYSLQFERALKNLTPNTERATKKQNAIWAGFRKKEESYYFFPDPVILINTSLSVKPSSRVSFFTRAHAKFALHQGLVVRTPVSGNPGFVFFLSKALSQIIFSILFRVSNHQIVGKENLTEFAF